MPPQIQRKILRTIRWKIQSPICSPQIQEVQLLRLLNTPWPREIQSAIQTQWKQIPQRATAMWWVIDLSWQWPTDIALPIAQYWWPVWWSNRWWDYFRIEYNVEAMFSILSVVDHELYRVFQHNGIVFPVNVGHQFGWIDGYAFDLWRWFFDVQCVGGFNPIPVF